MSSSTLTLYHGSRKGISGAIRPDLSDGACDFGCGFYMGTDIHQPQTLICVNGRRTIEPWEHDLCEMQGHLPELAWKRGYPQSKFVPAFMTSDVARRLDSPYSRFQWMGEEYALSAVTADSSLVPGCRPEDVDPEALFWMGYTYRYWHYLTGESSREMYALADYDRMRRVYPGYHTVSCELAVKWLKEARAK